jgi:hypothetical protein
MVIYTPACSSAAYFKVYPQGRDHTSIEDSFYLTLLLCTYTVHSALKLDKQTEGAGLLSIGKRRNTLETVE